MHTLTVRNISKNFGTRRVVDSVSFEVKSGQVIGLLGPNGAGKTTSFYMVVGIVKPDSGTVLLDDVSLQDRPMYQRARLGLSYLPQEPSIFRKLTVRENIMAVLENMPLSLTDRESRLQSLLEELSITHLVDSFAFQLSGGERRRVEVARALATNPHFMLLDEPFAGIDPIAVIELQKIINQLKASNIGILITDHNVRETLGICDLSYLLKDGHVQEVGTAEQLVNSPLARQTYLGENFRL
ncbi:MAG: LPS export ABC transporter ATP-binding protein [Deltaproteobacteria bacterium]|nr:LPS export ABC transporter ATP-binding protein [Deltaproteobacteria bacterium]